MTSVDWVAGKVRFIDQTRLPSVEIYIDTSDYRVVGEAIRTLQIRGAPAIGVAAAFAAVLPLQDPSITTREALYREFITAVEHLAGTRPTAVNLFAALDRMRLAYDRIDTVDLQAIRMHLLNKALDIQREDIVACKKIGEYGAALIAPGSSILTHCNTGALATAGEGTAQSIITTAARQHKIVRVFADETRPLFQGARLTSWELLKAGINVTLMTDSTAGTVLKNGWVHAVIVGADRIAANGDAANKIGTYPLAVLAAYHRVPLYVAAPTSTIDMGTPSGDDITIEERPPEEVTCVVGQRIAPEGVRVFSPAFDVTPNQLITAIVTEYGVLQPPYQEAIAELHRKGGTS